MCILKDTVVWIWDNFNNLSKQKPSETSAVKLYKGAVVTNINDIDVICVSCLHTYIYHSL